MTAYAEQARDALPSELAQLRSYADALNQRCVEDAADAVRLDWFEKHAVSIEQDRDFDGSDVWTVRHVDGNTDGKTARAAIDAAMKGE
jgi:hypothetical protein